MTLVEFVKDHRRDTVQQGIVLQHAREDAFGHDFDARAGRDLALEADAIADRLTDRFTELRSHIAGCCARRDTARFQHQDFARAPGGLKQRERYARGLAGAGRCFQHHTRPHTQACEQFGQDDVYGLGLAGHVLRRWRASRHSGGVRTACQSPRDKTKTAPAGAVVIPWCERRVRQRHPALAVRAD